MSKINATPPAGPSPGAEASHATVRASVPLRDRPQPSDTTDVVDLFNAEFSAIDREAAARASRHAAHARGLAFEQDGRSRRNEE